MEIPNPESCSGGNLISEIEGWYTGSPRPLVIISLLLMLSLVVLSYFVSSWWVDQFPSIFISTIVILFLSVLLGGVANQRVVFGWMARIAVILLFAGIGMLLGTLVSASRNLSLGVAPLVIVLALVFVAFLVEMNIRRKQEVLEIIVEGNYSLQLIRHLASRTKEMLDQNGLRYKKEGTSFDLQLSGTGRILVILHMGVKRDRTAYRITVVDEGVRDTSLLDELKDKIFSMILNEEQELGFDSYPKIDRILCKTCWGETIYLMISDEIYCRQCRSKRGDDRVAIMFSGRSGQS